MDNLRSNNKFSMKYYESFLSQALKEGYEFVTLKSFINRGCPPTGHAILRHDLDLKPQTLNKMLTLEKSLGLKSTIFVRVTGNEYNFLSYPVLNMVQRAFESGFEIGLHTSCVEFAKINNLNPIDVLELEINILKKFVTIFGIAPHRDLNYAYNSLPFIYENWKDISDLGIEYQAYQKNIEDSTVYINEGFNPHLCWRNYTPEDIIPTKKTMYISTHNHWWYEEHPFEDWK